MANLTLRDARRAFAAPGVASASAFRRLPHWPLAVAAALSTLGAVTPAVRGDGYSGIALYPLTTLDQDFPGPLWQASTASQTVGWNSVSHALLWSGPDGTATDLNPTLLAGFTQSFAYSTNGNQQVGYGYNAAGQQALLWSGSAASAVDLNPAGFTQAAALGIHGNQQVGYGYGGFLTNNVFHALLWSGTAASVIDLSPTKLPGFTDSQATATSGNQQVGYGSTGTDFHALLWTGTAASAVDLQPTNLPAITDSQALGTSGTQQVGFGNTTTGTHALLWTGTAASAIDLQPTNLPNFTDSVANGTNGMQQVGFGLLTGQTDKNALLWSGTAASAVDLQALLPGSWSDSSAYTIDAAGNVYGTAFGSPNGVNMGYYAVMWSPTIKDATWNGGNGNWSGAAGWSSSPNAPDDGVLAGVSYRVHVNAGSIHLDVNLSVVSLAVSAAAKIDVNNHLVTVQASNEADKQAQIALLNAAISLGANGASWTGEGITSSTAAADPAHLGVGLFDNAVLQRSTFGGSGLLDANSILIAVAHLGDANDNGIVDIQDLTIVANNWQQAGNNWAQGDLNRDGIVDIQDFTIVANNWQQSSNFSLQNGTPSLAPNPLPPTPSSVPEPASLSLFAALFFRKKRR